MACKRHGISHCPECTANYNEMMAKQTDGTTEIYEGSPGFFSTPKKTVVKKGNKTEIYEGSPGFFSTPKKTIVKRGNNTEIYEGSPGFFSTPKKTIKKRK